MVNVTDTFNDLISDGVDELSFLVAVFLQLFVDLIEKSKHVDLQDENVIVLIDGVLIEYT